MLPEKIEAFLKEMPDTCHDCGRSLVAASMVCIEDERIFVICRRCAIKRDPRDAEIMEFAHAQGMKQIAREN